MNKFQKILFAVFVALSLTAAFFGYRAIKNNKQPTLKAITLLPDSCDFMLQFDNYSEFSNTLRNKNLIWQDLKTLTALSHLEIRFDVFDSLISVNEDLNDLVSNNPVYAAFYKGGNYIITMNVKKLGEKDSYTDLISKVTTASLKNAKAELKDGVICVSNSDTHMARFFNQKNAKLIANTNFAALKNSANYSGTSIFVNSLSKSPLNNSYSNISLKPDKIVFNGISTKDTLGFYGQATAQPIKNPQFLEYIPLICNAFEVFDVDNGELAFSKKTDKDWWEEVNETALFNAKKQFYDNISSLAVKVFLPSKNQALVLPVKDTAVLHDLLPFITDSSNKTSSIRKLAYDYRSFSKSTFANLKLSELNYISVFDDRLVLTATQADAEIFVNADLNNSSILNNKSFAQYASKNFDSEFHYLSYGLINSLGKENIPLGNFVTEDDISKLKNIGHCSFVGTYKNNVLNFRLCVNYLQENFTDEPNILWTMNADTTITTTPCLFKNHLTQVNEIAFQTADKSLYLQNATGKTIWKKKLNEKITSGIFIVDAFKNKKYQLLFNSDNYIHLIDRNGNYVQGYPVKLPAKASNKLCVFDYENNNDLRLFIACTDNKIYNFSIWAIKQEGFKPFATSNHVTLPIKYCKVGPSDYLVTADVKGKIYAFSRKGDGRIDFKNKLIEDATDFDIVAGNTIANTQLIYFDDKNNLVSKISLADKKEVNKISETDKKIAYTFADFDGNKVTDIILSQPGAIEAYDLNGSKNYSGEITENSSPQHTAFFRLGSNTYVSIFDENSSNTIISLIEQKTTKEYKTTLPGFICDLYNDGKSYLLFIDGKQIKCSKL